MNQVMPFGLLLKRHRKAAGLTQEELATRAGISPIYVSLIETGRRRPHASTAYLLASALDVSDQDRAMLEAAIGARRTPADPPAAHASHALPAQLTNLIGREHETAAVVTLLRQGTTRLLTLTGPGGVGKTRLALRVAEEERDRFTDGVVFVPLAAVTDPDLVAVEIAQAVGARESSGASPLENVIAHVQGRQVLLVLDNFEQVTRAAPVVAGLLAACPRLVVIVTSRAPLRVRGEQQFAVPPLSAPDRVDRSDPNAVIRYAAVALFVARAREVRPDFALTPATAEAIVDICRRLDGLPLAIELAAARVTVLPPETLRERLTDRLGLLTGGAVDLPARQRTLRDTLAWSYDLLREGEQTLFRRLAVFAGSCPLDAVEQVCIAAGEMPGAMLDGLSALVDQSLLRLDAPGPAEERRAEPRFTMLETVRAYALERLVERGEDSATFKAHAQWFHDLAEAAQTHLAGVDQAHWLDRLEDDHDNLRAALRWSLEQGEAELGLALASALSPFWETRGHIREGCAWLDRFLALGHDVEAHARARALRARASLARLSTDFERAVSCAEQSAALCRALHDRSGLAAALNIIGATCYEQGMYPRAMAVYEQVRALYDELGDTAGLARTFNNLAAVAQCRGDYASAERLYEQSLARRRMLGNRIDIAVTLHNIGLIALEQGDVERAAGTLEESLALRRALGDTPGIAHSLASMGDLALYRGDYTEARDFTEQSLALRREMGDFVRAAALLVTLGDVMQKMGDAAAAVARYRESLESLQAVGDVPYIIAGCLERLAQIAAGHERPALAARLLGAAAARRDAADTPLTPVERAEHDQTVARIRANIGAEQFGRAWAAGRPLPLAQLLVETEP